MFSGQSLCLQKIHLPVWTGVETVKTTSILSLNCWVSLAYVKAGCTNNCTRYTILKLTLCLTQEPYDKTTWVGVLMIGFVEITSMSEVNCLPMNYTRLILKITLVNKIFFQYMCLQFLYHLFADLS